MLLKVIFNKAVKYIDENPIENGCLIIKIEASNAGLTVSQFIHRLDIRNLGTLRALIPNAFPKKLRVGEILAEKNSLGAWRVVPKPVEEK